MYSRRFRAEHPGIFSGFARMTMVCFLLGAVIGVFTYSLDLLLDFFTQALTHGLNNGTTNLRLLLMPFIGLTLVILFTRYIVHQPMDSGTERIILYLKENKLDYPARLMFAPVLASALTMGFGGSAGAEGPSAFTGAAIGSNVGRWFKLNDRDLQHIISIGAGAGIAGIFRSPLCGIFFALEVLRVKMPARAMIPMIVASVTAGLTTYIMGGERFELKLIATSDPRLIDFPFVVLLGIACGLYALYYVRVYHATERRLKSIGNIWTRMVVAATLIGVGIFIFPTLYGTGYPALDKMLNGTDSILTASGVFAGLPLTPLLLVGLAAGIVVVKAVICSATNYGGGVAGNFAPTLFAGGFVGFIFVTVANTWCGTALNPANYIYVGMAGAMAGIIKAPLMAMFLVEEMSGRTTFLWPLAVVSVISWLTVSMLTRTNVK